MIENTGCQIGRVSRLCVHISLIFLSITSLLGCGSSAPKPSEISSNWQLQDAAKVSGDGAAISQVAYPTTDWHKATVPGTVLSSLVDDGVYPDPMYGENNRPDVIPESLARASYWYRTQFAVPNEDAGKHIWLNFDGINYIADVWVNGQSVGRVSGAFARGKFDITSIVTPGQAAVAAVHIIPPPHPGTHAEKTVRSGTGPNGGILTEDGPTFLCTLGWDWIPTIRDRDIGIWQKVSLATTGDVLVQDPMMTSDLPLPRTDSADLSLEVTLCNVTAAPRVGTLNAAFEGVDFSLPITLGANETRVVKLNPASTAQLHVRNPRLWWPNGYGEPNLYHLHVGFEINHAESDARDVSFGIRKITYKLPDSDNLAISVNGVPVMCKGGDWGMDEAMKRIGHDRLEAQVRLHQQANYTMIRNWVGQSSSEDFYDLCDQYGIMIWDEFFQPNPSDGPNPVDNNQYIANVREKVIRFRNHPSIALWCGRNEGNPPPVIEAAIRKIMADLNPQRLYQPNSRDGRGVRSGGPYNWQAPRLYYNLPNGEAFKTEIGSVSIPTLEAIEAMMPSKDWEKVNDDWAEHDLTRGAQEGRRGPLYPDMIASRYGVVNNLADFARKSQLANYEAYRALYEGRFARLFRPCSGILTWMSNPSQPSFVWQIYSHDLEPNAALFAARKACESVHIQMNQNDFHVMVINNTPNDLQGWKARIRVLNLDGSVESDRKLIVAAGKSAASDLGTMTWPDAVPAVRFVKLELFDPRDRPVSDNFYWRADPAHQDDFTAMGGMGNATLLARIDRHDDGDKCLLDVTLTNSSPTPAVMAHIQLHRKGSGERVLPVYYSDNYISLLSGESRTISIEAGIADLHGDEPLVALDGWNVSASGASFSGAAFSENREAQGVTSSGGPIFNR